MGAWGPGWRFARNTMLIGITAAFQKKPQPCAVSTMALPSLFARVAQFYTAQELLA